MCRSAIACVLALSILGAACDDDEPAARPSPTAAPTVEDAPTSEETAADADASTCANEDAATGDAAVRAGGSLTGDIDGDGAADDSTYIVVDEAAPRGCQAFLVVETAEGRAAVPVWTRGAQSGLPQPQLNSLAGIDGRPGSEIVVDEAAGASTQFVGAFAYRDGDVARLAFEEDLDVRGLESVESLFPFGGSVGHLEAVGCEPGGLVVVSVAVPGSREGDLDRGIYRLQRYFFRIEGTDLELERNEDERVPVERLESFEEFVAGPFGNC